MCMFAACILRIKLQVLILKMLVRRKAGLHIRKICTTDVWNIVKRDVMTHAKGDTNNY